MDEETSGPTRPGSPLRPLLTYGVPYIGAGVWALAKFPEQLRWTGDIFARVFGLAAPFYEDLTHVDGYGEALEAALEVLETAPARVLDLCCGTGFAARQIQHTFPDAQVVGIDLSPEMVLMARREADENGFDIELEVGDARDLELDDESFDLVVSHNAPPYPEETMRVLRPGGIALTVWSFGGPWVRLAWPVVAKRLRKAGALHADGYRAGPGFYGVAEKSGIRRRRRPRTDASAPRERAAARAAPPSARTRAPSRGRVQRSASRPPPEKPPAEKPQAPAEKPQAAKPQAAKPQAAKPQAAKPQAEKPQAAKPSAAKPSAAKPSAAKPSAAKPSAAKPSGPTAKSRARRTGAAGGTPPGGSPS